MAYAQVHRFRDLVACYVGGETCYLTPAEARKISAALNKAAADVRRFPKFGDSKVGTFELKVDGTKSQGCS